MHVPGEEPPTEAAGARICIELTKHSPLCAFSSIQLQRAGTGESAKFILIIEREAPAGANLVQQVKNRWAPGNGAPYVALVQKYCSGPITADAMAAQLLSLDKDEKLGMKFKMLVDKEFGIKTYSGAKEHLFLVDKQIEELTAQVHQQSAASYLLEPNAARLDNGLISQISALKELRKVYEGQIPIEDRTAIKQGLVQGTLSILTQILASQAANLGAE